MGLAAGGIRGLSVNESEFGLDESEVLADAGFRVVWRVVDGFRRGYRFLHERVELALHRLGI